MIGALFRWLTGGVLDRVPRIELANEVLFNLSEVYGAEQRYMDQLELLRTVGRLGRNSKRYHAPGEPVSIVVQDSDLGVSRGHARIPVHITVGEPITIERREDVAAATARLKAVMQAQLDAQQAAYPPLTGGELRWVPARLGGFAPTPEEAYASEHRDMNRRTDRFG